MPEYLFKNETHNTYLECQAFVSNKNGNFTAACRQFLVLANKKDIANAAEFYNLALITGIISEAGPIKDGQLA
jgi:hypothetical protein